MKELKSFEALAAKLEKDDFDRVLKGKFNRIAPGSFESELPGVFSITLVPVYGKHPSLNLALNYGAADTLRHATLSMFEDGALSGKIPADLTVTREEIKRELIRIIELIRLDFWHATDLDILPESDPGEFRTTEEENDVHFRKDAIDPKRLQFLGNQQDALFGFMNGKVGFNGYFGAAFQGPEHKAFVVLEHPEWGNAVYILSLSEPIAEEAATLEKMRGGKLEERELDETIRRVWSPIAEKARTRQSLRREFNAERIVHTGAHWQERLQEAIDRRLQEHAPN